MNILDKINQFEKIKTVNDVVNNFTFLEISEMKKRISYLEGFNLREINELMLKKEDKNIRKYIELDKKINEISKMLDLSLDSLIDKDAYGKNINIIKKKTDFFILNEISIKINCFSFN